MKNKRIILVFAGEIAAGKSAVTEYLIKKHRASYYKFSTPVRDILERLHKEVNRENLSALSTSLRKIFGEDFLVHVLIKDIIHDKNNLLIFDGLRKLDELKYLKKIKGLKFIYVLADEKIRYQRLIKRGEKEDDRKKSRAQFKRDHKLASEKDISRLKKSADYLLDNSGSLADLHENIEKIINKIKK